MCAAESSTAKVCIGRVTGCDVDPPESSNSNFYQNFGNTTEGWGRCHLLLAIPGECLIVVLIFFAIGYYDHSCDREHL